MTNGARWTLLFHDKITLATTTLCLACLAASGWFVFEAGKGGNEPRPRRYTHMHCPACGEEVAYTASRAAGRCEACVLAPPYVPTVGSVKAGAGGGVWVRGIAFIAVATIVLEGLAYFYVLRARALNNAEERKRNQRLICACPFCSRKISYPIARAGTGVLCSGCKTAFSLAGVGEAEVEAAG
jgi:ribosomal protein L37AE/L43A